MSPRKPLSHDASPGMKQGAARPPKQGAKPETKPGSKRPAKPSACEDVTPACPRRPRGPSLDKTAQTRQQILQAALREFVEQGIARTTMERIARRAEVAKGTIYVYYPSKEELLRGVIEHALRQSAVYQPLVRENGESIQALLRRSLLPTMQALELSDRAELARLVLSEARHDPVLARLYKELAFDPWQRLMEKLLQMAVDEGELHTVSVVHCAQLMAGPFWMTMVHNGLLRSADAPALELEPLLNLLIDQMFAPPAKR